MNFSRDEKSHDVSEESKIKPEVVSKEKRHKSAITE